MSKMNNGLRWLWLSLAALIADLVSKYVVVQRFELHESINLLPVFNLTYARNYGAAFSFLSDQGGWQKWFFLGLAVAVCIGLTLMLARNQAVKKVENAAYALIIGGAIGNAIDRAYHGFVVDFLHVYWNDAHFPVFNIADVAITIGAGLLILDALLAKKEKKAE